MKKKIGVYICSGCEIGKSIDIEKLSNSASTEQNIKLCKNHSSLCSTEGFDLINNDIASENLDGIIIAACSPRAKTEVFDFMPDSTAFLMAISMTPADTLYLEARFDIKAVSK